MSYAISTLAIAAAIIWHITIFRLSPRLGLVKFNFNKKPVMASYGIVAFGYIAAIVCSVAAFGRVEWQNAGLYLAVMGAMWALGALDDVFGNRDVGGFKGHFNKLIFEHKLTTGALKAIGGGIVGLTAGWFIANGDIRRWLPAGLLIPAAANTLNLLDLRPGRAVAVFFLGIVVTCSLVGCGLVAPWIVASIVIVALAFARMDVRGRAMMGDSGSNALGAALGLTVAVNCKTWVALVVIAICAAIQLYSEGHSISALIERNAVLRSIDRRLGVR